MRRSTGPSLLAPPARVWTSAELVALVRKRYTGRDAAVFEQVANSTGARGDRYADVIALDLWPSAGLHLHGFEVKVSRGDWLRELRDPKKADAIARYCDCWWIVAAPAIVGRSELRPGWGLLEPHEELLHGGAVAFDLRIVVSAKPSEPQPVLDRGFVAAILRRAAADNKQGAA